MLSLFQINWLPKCPIKMRVFQPNESYHLALSLLHNSKENGTLILMKISHFDRTPQCTDTNWHQISPISFQNPFHLWLDRSGSVHPFHPNPKFDENFNNPLRRTRVKVKCIFTAAYLQSSFTAVMRVPFSESTSYFQGNLITFDSPDSVMTGLLTRT